MIRDFRNGLIPLPRQDVASATLRGSLRRVINRVTLRWPALPAHGDQALENAIRRLENGVEADLHPVFGEVFSLVATKKDDLRVPVPG